MGNNLKISETVDSIQYFLKIVFSVADKGKHVVFRGQADKDWKLIPSLLRYENKRDNSRYIYKHLSKYKYTNIASENGDFIEELVNLQHYGIPTCLLDWTKNALVALFFCVSEFFDKDGYVFVIDPVRVIEPEDSDWQVECKELRNLYYSPENYLTVYDEKLAAKIFRKYKTSKCPQYSYTFLEPNFSNDRVKVQSGLFVAIKYLPKKIFDNKRFRNDLTEEYLNDLLNDKKVNEEEKKFILSLKVIIEKNKDRYQKHCNEEAALDFYDPYFIPNSFKKEKLMLYKEKNSKFLADLIGKDSYEELFEDELLLKIEVKSENKRKILEQLEKFLGISYNNIYPDFEGVSKFIDLKY